MKKVLGMTGLVYLIFSLSCASYLINRGTDYVLNNGFEKGKMKGWQALAGCEVTVSRAAAYTGEYGLEITGGKEGKAGVLGELYPGLKKGTEYSISGWIKLAAGGVPQSEVSLSIERELNGKTRSDRIAGPQSLSGEVWVKLEGTYVLASDVDAVRVCFECPGKKAAFFVDNVTIRKIGEVDLSQVEQKWERNIPSLGESLRDFFPVGAAISGYQLFGEEGELINYHYTSITAENAMKPEAIQPEEGVFTFAEADKLVEFALANNKLVRGHTLVWHRAVPDWFFKGANDKPVTREVLLKRLETHIKTLVGRYKGKIYAWDVVNEPVEKYAETDYRETDWYAILGEDYIEKALRWAHEADPEAKLFLNDYEVYDTQKGEKLFNLAKRLKDRGVPLHGIGIQFHISIVRPGITALKNTLDLFRELGLEIHITELDMTVYQNEEQKDFGEVPGEILIRQGHRFKEVFEVLKANSDLVRNVTFWGFQDGDSFLTREEDSRANAPLLFTPLLKAKYAFWGIVDPSRLPPDVVLDLGQKEPDIVEARRGTPVIDGVEDEIWKKANTIYTEIFIMDRQGATAAVRTLWDEANLYVYAHIKDDNVRAESGNPWEQDSFEVFIDENNHKSMNFEKDDAQYRVNYQNKHSFGGYHAEIISETVLAEDGYFVELAIAFKTITPAVGTKIGFDIQVNDDMGNGKRESQSKWNDPTNEGYRNTSGFGILVMAE